MELFTKADAAEYLKVSQRTIDNYIQRGLLTALRPSGDLSGPVRLSAEEVRNFFRANDPDCVDANKK